VTPKTNTRYRRLITSAAGLAIWLLLQLVGLAMTFGSMRGGTP